MQASVFETNRGHLLRDRHQNEEVDVVLNSSSGSPALVLSCARPCAVLRAWGFGRFSSLACSVIIK